MANDYYAPSGAPGFNAFGSSASMRAEFTAIGTAFNKLAPLGGNALRLVQVNAAGSGQQVVADFTVAQVKAMLDGPGAGIFNTPIQVPYTAPLSGLVAGGLGDAFATDGNKVLANYGLSWKQFTDTPAGPSAALTGFGGIRLYTAGTERVRVNTLGLLQVGVGSNTSGAIAIRNDQVPDGPTLTFINKAQAGGLPHKLGRILFDAYRDVQDPSIVAGLWAEGQTPFYNYADLVFGASANGTAVDYPAERLRISGNTGAVTPGADNAQPLGAGGLRFSVLYAGSGSINTSDAREKTAVQPLTAAELAAAKALAGEIGTYRFLAAIAAKGSAARHHAGLTVQRAIEVLQSHGLDPMRYGFICRDEWPAKGAAPAGDRYSFRPDELLLFLARGIDARLAALEAA